MNNELVASADHFQLLTSEGAILIVDDLLAQLIDNAILAKSRLEIMSSSENQTELQLFLCDAVKLLGVKLQNEVLKEFINEACYAFIDRKMKTPEKKVSSAQC